MMKLKALFMAEAIMGFTINTPPTSGSSLLRQKGSSFGNLAVPWQQVHVHNKTRGLSSGQRVVKANAIPIDFDHLNLMAVLVQRGEGLRDFVTVKSVWHLSDQAIKNVYVFYVMFFCWGCLFFGSTKDPYYDSEAYRKDGGDGTGHWVYEKQEDIEEQARAELWREELIEEIEKRVEDLPELEEVISRK
ncbi:Photosynthetic NDH subunit of subcomplex B 4, chloroplastic [Linum perenne]